MKCILAVAFAVVLVVAEGKVLPASDVDNQQTGESPSLDQMFREAQATLANVGTQIREQLNLPTDDIASRLREGSRNFTNNVQNFVRDITEEMKSKSPELEEAWTNFKTKVNEIVDKININPETTEQLNQLNERFQEGVRNLVTQSENAAKSFTDNSEKLREDINKFTKSAVDIAVEASQNLNNQLQHHAASQAQS